MAKNDFYRVPNDEQREYQNLVKRANRAIYSNMQYIQREDIKDESVKRALLGQKAVASAWHTNVTPFSGTIRFNTEKEYDQYTRMLKTFGGEGVHGEIKGHSVEAKREEYYNAIIKSLNTLATSGGANVLLKNGNLPKKITDGLKSLTLEQMIHYFDEGDPEEAIDYLYYKWEDYAAVEDRGDFIDVTLRHINALKEVYPSKQQRAIRDFYKGKYPNKSVAELETIHKRNMKRKAKAKSKRKRKK